MLFNDITPSDVALIVDFVLATILALVFALGRPRSWVRDRLGWVIFYYSVSTVAILFLIVWGIVFGQPIDEPIRFLVGGALALGLAWKTWAIISERRAGRRERMQTTTRYPRKDVVIMSSLDPADYQNGEPIKPVTTDADGNPTLAPSPKVIAGVAASGALVVVVAVLTAVTPELLSFAGPWAPVLFAGVVALAGFLGSYIKRP